MSDPLPTTARDFNSLSAPLIIPHSDSHEDGGDDPLRGAFTVVNLETAAASIVFKSGVLRDVIVADIYINGTPSGSYGVGLRLNNDTAANYTWSHASNAGGTAWENNELSSSSTLIDLGGNITGNVNTMAFHIIIYNARAGAAVRKVVAATGMKSFDGAIATEFWGSSGEWRNTTDPVTRIDVVISEGTATQFAANSLIAVSGYSIRR